MSQSRWTTTARMRRRGGISAPIKCISLSITNHATAQPYCQRSESRMILAVGNTKGGVGKTTLAVNLAVARALAGRDLLLLDGDEQGTALTFTELRADRLGQAGYRSEEHTYEIQSLMRISYAVFCLKKTQPYNVIIQ